MPHEGWASVPLAVPVALSTTTPGGTAPLIPSGWLPTLLMGATLPAIARWVETTPQGVSWLGFFYGGNLTQGVGKIRFLNGPLRGFGTVICLNSRHFVYKKSENGNGFSRSSRFLLLVDDSTH